MKKLINTGSHESHVLSMEHSLICSKPCMAYMMGSMYYGKLFLEIVI